MFLWAHIETGVIKLDDVLRDRILAIDLPRRAMQ
jgi:hypothetical protein